MLILFTLIAASEVWETIPNLKTFISLAAFALAVVLSVMLAWLKSKRRRIPNSFWVVVVALVLIGVVATLYQPNGIYRVRVTVLDEQGKPTEDADVTSTFGGEAQKVKGGWQFVIPAASKPRDSKIMVIATKESAFLKGEETFTLEKEMNPAVIVKMQRAMTAKVRGQIVDSKNRGVVGARVFVVGFDGDVVITKEGGSFELPAHAAIGQKVMIHAEKTGYRGAKRLHQAGDAPLIMTLER